MTVKRIATIAGATLLATTTLTAPAQASFPFSCETGRVIPSNDGSLHVSGENCNSPVHSGGVNAEVTIRTGPAAGKYLCGLVLTYELHNNLGGFNCHPI
ncbi:hypothetical protein GCM10009850_119600 [Nonomuraea monospora]|uniref:Secreted protein n=1 Tax=Nonomuraea monospora TaxID=568818 RepID=A0ABP5PXN2_9ACTN